jgi:hypothetical protein
MKNITLSLDEELLKQARVYAAQQSTTINRLIREYLERLVRQEERSAQARKRLLELAETSEGRLGSDWKWNREEIYEDRLLPRHERPNLRGFGED